ncbi:hypothetical protein ACQEVS_01470 [Streptomyces sp. CA-181903]|uniref:hypothetical protein n=1 Tax=Streptomyces sp. CA-181903 TaxID=3240055 RepID=UPI003D94EEF8
MPITPLDDARRHLPVPPGPRIPPPVQTVVFTWWRHLWAPGCARSTATWCP